MNDDTICYVGGTFDLFHIGHVILLRRCKWAFDTVCVGVNTDEFNLRYKHHLPVFSLKDRLAILKSCRYVDRIYINNGCEDSKPTILKSGAKTIVHGNDWPEDALMKQMGLTQEWLDANGITFRFFPTTPNISSTQICQQLKSLSPDITKTSVGAEDSNILV